MVLFSSERPSQFNICTYHIHILRKIPLWLSLVSSAIVLNPILCMCYSLVHFLKTNWVVWNIYSCIVWYKYALKYMIDRHHYALLSLALRCCLCKHGTSWLPAWWNSSFSVDRRNLHQYFCCSFLYWYSCMLYCIVFILLGIRRRWRLWRWGLRRRRWRWQRRRQRRRRWGLLGHPNMCLLACQLLSVQGHQQA